MNLLLTAADGTSDKHLRHPWAWTAAGWCETVSVFFPQTPPKTPAKTSERRERMLPWQLGSVPKLSLISFLGIQCRLLHKRDYLSQSQGFSCARILHSASFIQGWIASLELWSHHVNTCARIQPWWERAQGHCCDSQACHNFPGCCIVKNWDMNRFRWKNLAAFMCVRLCFLHRIPNVKNQCKSIKGCFDALIFLFSVVCHAIATLSAMPSYLGVLNLPR